jgi:hypothetical protein
MILILARRQTGFHLLAGGSGMSTSTSAISFPFAGKEMTPKEPAKRVAP